MEIGYFGGVVFSTSDKKILSFRDFKLTAAGNWGEHKRVGKKPQWEFLGPSPQKVSFVIELDANFGVKPRKMIQRLIGYAEKGTINMLVIGGKKVGSKWRTTNVSSAWSQIIDGGELIRASVTLTLEEYQ